MQNVLHRPLRTFITVLAVAVEVTLVIIVVGLTSGLLSESAKRIEGVGADIMVQPPQASYLMAFSGAPMPIAIADKLSAAGIRAGRRPRADAVQYERHRNRLRHRAGELSRCYWRIRFSRRARFAGARTTSWWTTSMPNQKK